MGIKNRLLGVLAVIVIILGLVLSIPSGGTSVVAGVFLAGILLVVMAKGALFS